MTRHHVISTTGCDVFYALVTHYRDSLGAHFDKYGSQLREAGYAQANPYAHYCS